MIYEQGGIEVKQYFDFSPKVYDISYEDAEDEIRVRLKEAVRRQLVSDVPVGVYLSGGMDSSSLGAMMSDLGVNDIPTFTLGFNEPTDEFEDAMEYVGRTPPESIWSTPEDDWSDVRAPQIGTSPGRD